MRHSSQRDYLKQRWMAILRENYGFRRYVCKFECMWAGSSVTGFSIGVCGAIGPSKTDAATAAWKPSPSYIVPVCSICRRHPLARSSGSILEAQLELTGSSAATGSFSSRSRRAPLTHCFLLTCRPVSNMRRLSCSPGYSPSLLCSH